MALRRSELEASCHLAVSRAGVPARAFQVLLGVSDVLRSAEPQRGGAGTQASPDMVIRPRPGCPRRGLSGPLQSAGTLKRCLSTGPRAGAGAGRNVLPGHTRGGACRGHLLAAMPTPPLGKQGARAAVHNLSSQQQVSCHCLPGNYEYVNNWISTPKIRQ